jgi:hypothetical protein
VEVLSGWHRNRNNLVTNTTRFHAATPEAYLGPPHTHMPRSHMHAGTCKRYLQMDSDTVPFLSNCRWVALAKRPHNTAHRERARQCECVCVGGGGARPAATAEASVHHATQAARWQANCPWETVLCAVA